MVFIHFADGFEEIEAITTVDVLRRAGVEVCMVSITGSLQVRGTHDITVLVDMLYEDADYSQCDMIVLPGGMPGTTNLASHEGLIRQIRDFASNNRWIAAICAAPMVMGDLSLLKDKKATIFPGLEDHLIGARFSSDRVVVDGNMITSRGAGTAMEFALMLAEILKGEQKSAMLRKAMLV